MKKAYHIRRNITLDPEVDKRAREIAKATCRSFSGLIELSLRRVINQVDNYEKETRQKAES